MNPTVHFRLRVQNTKQRCLRKLNKVNQQTLNTHARSPHLLFHLQPILRNCSTFFPPRAACCSVASFQGCSAQSLRQQLFQNPSTMATTPDHNDAENDPPTVTNHPGDLTSISERLAILERALTTVPTSINPPASSSPSLTVIQDRLRCGP